MARRKLKKGPKIGQPGPLRRRKKNHPKYKKSHRQKTQTFRKDMPGSSGFVYLEGSGLYLAKENRFVVTVSSKPREDNRGPAIYLKRTIEDWNRARNEDGSIPEVIHEVLYEVAADVIAGVYPERDMFLERCNNTGQTVDAFIDEVCTTCRCWYCDLSS